MEQDRPPILEYVTAQPRKSRALILVFFIGTMVLAVVGMGLLVLLGDGFRR